MKKLTTKEFIEKARKVHGDKYDYSKVEYVNRRTKVCIICPEHGEFWQLPESHTKGCGCPLCGQFKVKLLRTFSKEDIIKKCENAHGDKYLYDLDSITDTQSKIRIYCKVHKLWFYQGLYNHISGCGCKFCSQDLRNKHLSSDSETFIKKANVVHNNLYNYSNVNYVNNKTLVSIICKIHGEFYQTPHGHLSGKGCPYCKLKTQNKLYLFIKTFIPDLKFEFSPSWLKPQRFDMYSESHNLAIEYNGELHYIEKSHFGGMLGLLKTQERDKLKIQKCNQNGCKLYTIKYDDIDYDKIKEDINNLIVK